MRRLVVTALLLWCATPTAFAQERQAEFAQEIARVLQLEPQMLRIARSEVDPGTLATIYLILQNTQELYIHRQRGATENSVYVHPDGREAVYDADGELVQDGINDGSYNYHDPVSRPLRHFTFDICPWIMMGNSRRDPTSVDERINSYMNDLAGGIAAAAEKREELATWEQSTWPETGQREALAVFLLAVEAGRAEELFGLFDSEEPLTEEALTAVVIKLADGFVTIYSQG